MGKLVVRHVAVAVCARCAWWWWWCGDGVGVGGGWEGNKGQRREWAGGRAAYSRKVWYCWVVLQATHQAAPSISYTTTLPPWPHTHTHHVLGRTCVEAAEEVADGQQAAGGALQQGGQPKRGHLDGCRDTGWARSRAGTSAGTSCQLALRRPALPLPPMLGSLPQLAPSPAPPKDHLAHPAPPPHTPCSSMPHTPTQLAAHPRPPTPPAKPCPSALCAASIDFRKTLMRLSHTLSLSYS